MKVRKLNGKRSGESGVLYTNAPDGTTEPNISEMKRAVGKIFPVHLTTNRIGNHYTQLMPRLPKEIITRRRVAGVLSVDPQYTDRSCVSVMCVLFLRYKGSYESKDSPQALSFFHSRGLFGYFSQDVPPKHTTNWLLPVVLLELL